MDIKTLKSENSQLLAKLENIEQLYAHLEDQMMKNFEFKEVNDKQNQEQNCQFEEHREEEYDEIIHYPSEVPKLVTRDYLPNTHQIVKTEQDIQKQSTHKNDCEVEIFEWGLRQIKGTAVQYQGDIRDKALWNQVLEDNIEGFIGNRFDVILTDAPWDSTALKLDYNTLNDGQIMNSIPIEELQQDGYLLMWITNKKLEVALKYLEDHNYERIEIITWVKMKIDGLLRNNIGYYLRHFTEFCLVARKKGSFHNLRMISHTHNAPNIIVEPVRQGSRKPDQLYDIIETMYPHGKYLEIFGRAHNQRQEWTTIGNESIRKFVKKTKEQKKGIRQRNNHLCQGQVIHSLE